MKKTILAINEGGSDNLGDQAISKSLELLLLEKGYSVESYNFTQMFPISKINNLNKSLNLNSKNNFLFKFRLIRILALIVNKSKNIINISKKRYPLAFIGGGQLLLSNRSFPLSMLLWVIILRLYNTKVVIIGVGAGDSFSFFNKLALKIALKLSSQVFIRDQKSIQKVKDTFNIESSFIPDLAYCYSKKEDLNDNIIEYNLIVGIAEYTVYKMYVNEIGKKLKTEDEYIDEWVKDILSLDFKISKITFATTTSEDLEYSYKLYKKLLSKKQTFKTEYISQVLNLDEYTLLLKKSDAIMSARMHSLILGHLFGCKVVPWEISKKIQSYQKEYLKKDIDIIQKNIRDMISISLENKI